MKEFDELSGEAKIIWIIFCSVSNQTAFQLDAVKVLGTERFEPARMELVAWYTECRRLEKETLAARRAAQKRGRV